MRSRVCLADNFVSLVAEFGGELAMRGEYLGGGMNLLSIAG